METSDAAELTEAYYVLRKAGPERGRYRTDLIYHSIALLNGNCDFTTGT